MGKQKNNTTVILGAVSVLVILICIFIGIHNSNNKLEITGLKSVYKYNGYDVSIKGKTKPNTKVYLYDKGSTRSDKPEDVTKSNSNGKFKLVMPDYRDETAGKYFVRVKYHNKKVDKKISIVNGKEGKKLAKEQSKTNKAYSEKAASESAVQASKDAASASSKKAAKESSQAIESSKKAASKSSSKAASESSAAAYSASVASSEAYEKSPESYNTGITYDQLARTPDDYMAKKVSFSGTVIQVLEDDGVTEMRLAVNGNYDTILLVDIADENRGKSHVLEDDNLTVYGVSMGTVTYESTIGSKITVPSVEADRLQY